MHTSACTYTYTNLHTFAQISHLKPPAALAGQMHFDGSGCSRNVTRAMEFWGEAVRGWGAGIKVQPHFTGSVIFGPPATHRRFHSAKGEVHTHATHEHILTHTQVSRFGNFNAIYAMGLLHLNGYASDSEVTLTAPKSQHRSTRIQISMHDRHFPSG